MPGMNKVELIAAIYGKLDGEHTKKDIEKILTATCDCVMEAVAQGEEVKLVGFGTFSKQERKGREGRNPSTGQKMAIPESTVAKFKAGKAFRDTVNV
jgi:DNA-binding protein HU-beta